jgi:hypothetical protein
MDRINQLISKIKLSKEEVERNNLMNQLRIEKQQLMLRRKIGHFSNTSSTSLSFSSNEKRTVSTSESSNYANAGSEHTQSSVSAPVAADDDKIPLDTSFLITKTKYQNPPALELQKTPSLNPYGNYSSNQLAATITTSINKPISNNTLYSNASNDKDDNSTAEITNSAPTSPRVISTEEILQLPFFGTSGPTVIAEETTLLTKVAQSLPSSDQIEVLKAFDVAPNLSHDILDTTATTNSKLSSAENNQLELDTTKPQDTAFEESHVIQLPPARAMFLSLDQPVSRARSLTHSPPYRRTVFNFWRNPLRSTSKLIQ